MHVYLAKYLKPDSEDKAKMVEAIECYVSDSAKAVLEKVMEHINKLDGEFISIGQHNPVLAILKEDEQKI